MPAPSKKLADSLDALRLLQDQGKIAIRSSDLHRSHRERLLQNGFLQEVIKGWYISAHPHQAEGESIAWFASFWSFCSEYLRERFNNNWYLSPEQSIGWHVGNLSIPKQLIVRSPNAKNNVTQLLQNTSILDVKSPMLPALDIEEKNGLNVLTLTAALIDCSPAFFRQNPIDVKAALSMITNTSDILARLLNDGNSIIAGRLAGGFRNIGKSSVADQILQTMKAAGFDCHEANPFESPALGNFLTLGRSGHVNHITLMWHSMRQVVLDCFPNSPGLPIDTSDYLNYVQEIYTADAYNSLSIEGYRVSSELIDKVKLGGWNPDTNEEDRKQRDTLAARGYYQAYQHVKESVAKVLNNENAGNVAADDHPIWYRELFMPSVNAGLSKVSDLAGYRNGPVYIQRSRHVPPSKEAVYDLMSVLFDLLRKENEAAVRVVLGHFLFVYIHPYLDGNGRIGRFLMNLMLASGGYQWTVIPVSHREPYMNSLEEASVNKNIKPFSELIGTLVYKSMSRKSKIE